MPRHRAAGYFDLRCSDMKDATSHRYLVTGARGFIGTALCRFLQARHHKVRAVLRRPGAGPWDEQFACDLGAGAIPQSLMHGIDGIFHLAGLAHVRDIGGVPEALYRRVNVDATAALLEAASQHGIQRFVYFSSVKAAADPPSAGCVDEHWDALPSDAYGGSKRAAEQLVLAFGETTEMHVCNLRPCLVYGVGVKGNLARMITAIERGTFPPLPELDNRRSMVGLDDLTRAAWLAMRSHAADRQTYIVADGQRYSTRVLFVAISRALGKPVPKWTVPRSALRAAAMIGDVAARITRRPMPFGSSALNRLVGSACYRSDHIQDELGWRPQETFFSALPKIVQTRR